jgi:hypothetical protein
MTGNEPHKVRESPESVAGFVGIRSMMMRHRPKPVHLVVDGLPAHKTKLVKDYVRST